MESELNPGPSHSRVQPLSKHWQRVLLEAKQCPLEQYFLQTVESHAHIRKYWWQFSCHLRDLTVEKTLPMNKHPVSECYAGLRPLREIYGQSYQKTEDFKLRLRFLPTKAMVPKPIGTIALVGSHSIGCTIESRGRA